MTRRATDLIRIFYRADLTCGGINGLQRTRAIQRWERLTRTSHPLINGFDHDIPE